MVNDVNDANNSEGDNSEQVRCREREKGMYD